MKAGIAGAGIAGRLLAFALIRKGWHVTVFDQSNENSCSHTAAGLLTPVSELDKAESIIYALGHDAIHTYWPDIIRHCSEPVYFKHAGSITVAHPRDVVELTHFIRRVSHKSEKSYSLLNKQELSLLEPEITKFNEGYFFPDEAQIDSQSILIVLKNELLNRGVQWHGNYRVESVKPGYIDAQAFDVVFDCRGLGAKACYPQLRGLRGELIWLHAPDVNIQRPIRYLHPRYSVYIAPRPDHVYIVGASEIESDDASPVSVQTTLELLTAVYHLHAGFAEARIIKNDVNHRPTLPHHLPRITYADEYIALNGLYRHGYLITPTLVNDIMLWLDNRTSIRYPQLWEKLDDHRSFK